jgi:hypothetical protein
MERSGMDVLPRALLCASVMHLQKELIERL